MKLMIDILNPSLLPLYTQKFNHPTDSGFDLYPNTTDPVVVPPLAKSFKIPCGLRCAPFGEDISGYFLFARSSIVKTPLRLANSVGIIDSTYRGEIMAVVDNISDTPFVLSPTTSLFQLCAPDLKPIQVVFYNELPETQRGSGGFGSTH